MNTFKAERVYSKRETEKSDWSGRIGSTVLEVKSEGDIVVTLDGKVLPAGSVEYLLNFALQSMQDAYAGADSLSAAIGAFEKKRDAIINGTLGARGSGDGTSHFQTIARRIVRGLFKTKHGAKSEKWLEFSTRSDADQNAELDAMYTRNAEKLRPVVENEILRLNEEAARKAAITGGVEIDL